MKKAPLVVGYLLLIFGVLLPQQLQFWMRELLPWSLFYYTWLILLIVGGISLGLGLKLFIKIKKAQTEGSVIKTFSISLMLFLCGFGIGGLFWGFWGAGDFIIVKLILSNSSR